MRFPITTKCVECDARFTTDYLALGHAVECPKCGRLTVPQIPTGTQYPDTQYHLSYEDFCTLLCSPDTQSSVASLLRQWFGFRVRGTESDTSIVDRRGRSLALYDVHMRIQHDRSKHRQLYDLAMSYWR